MLAGPEEMHEGGSCVCLTCGDACGRLVFRLIAIWRQAPPTMPDGQKPCDQTNWGLLAWVVMGAGRRSIIWHRKGHPNLTTLHTWFRSPISEFNSLREQDLLQPQACSMDCSFSEST